MKQVRLFYFNEKREWTEKNIQCTIHTTIPRHVVFAMSEFDWKSPTNSFEAERISGCFFSTANSVECIAKVVTKWCVYWLPMLKWPSCVRNRNFETMQTIAWIEDVFFLKSANILRIFHDFHTEKWMSSFYVFVSSCLNSFFL